MSQEACDSNIVLKETLPIRKAPSMLVSALEYFLMFIIILEFNTVFIEIDNSISRLIYVAIAVTLLLCYIKRELVRLDPIITLLLIGAVLPFLNVSPGGENKFIKYFIVVLPLFIIYLKANLRNSVDDMFAPLLKFSNLMVLFALISLAYWVFASNLGIIQPTIWVPNGWVGHERLIPAYHFLYYETQETAFMGYATVRNSGMFEEAPMYNMVLCTALAIEVFIRPRFSRFRALVLFVTILTTFTTTGFIFLTILISWLLYRFLGDKFRSLMIVLVPLLFYVMYMVSSFIIEDKRSDSGEGSFVSRMRDIENCIDIGLDHPLLGQGLFTKKLTEEDGGNAAYGYSNSLFTLFADGGLYTAFLYFFCLVIIPFRYYNNFKDAKWPLAMFLFFLLFTFTASQFKLLTLFFVAVGLSFYFEIEKVASNEENGGFKETVIESQ